MKEVVKEEEEVRARYHETNIQLLKKKRKTKRKLPHTYIKNPHVRI